MAGDGLEALQYLAPYVFKVAISEHRILDFDEHVVRFRYQKPHSHRVRTMTLPIMEFMRRFLQHVLPRGFMKVRYYTVVLAASRLPIFHAPAMVGAHDRRGSVYPGSAPRRLSGEQPAGCPVPGHSTVSFSLCVSPPRQDRDDVSF